jgi:hypothetical protein
MQKLVLGLSVTMLLIFLALRPSPRGWTEQSQGPTPTPVATVETD